jgi:hypothetical protein
MVEKKKYEYLKALHEIFISGISALNVVTNNADTIRLSTFTGKKIWVVVLSVFADCELQHFFATGRFEKQGL